MTMFRNLSNSPLGRFFITGLHPESGGFDATHEREEASLGVGLQITPRRGKLGLIRIVAGHRQLDIAEPDI
jgi:hypothetical protein